jgi:hypothetical protein
MASDSAPLRRKGRFGEFIREFYTRCSAQKSPLRLAVEVTQWNFWNGILPENALRLMSLARPVCASSDFAGNPRLPHRHVKLQVSAPATKISETKG